MGKPALLTLLSPQLLQQALAHFPEADAETMSATLIEKGGSDRRFYRLALNAGRSVILVQDGGQKEENRHYVSIARFLDSRGIRVPRILFDAPGLIWMEDLGVDDLWSYRAEPWERRRWLYRKTLEQGARLHALSPVEAAEIQLQPTFDEALYRWEQQYFWQNCLGRHFGWSVDQLERLEARKTLAKIAAQLAELPRCLVHRDFQSQNVLIRGEDAWLIDFQGLRTGLAAYDLASLLYDPYVDFSPAERTALLHDYREMVGKTEEFDDVFRRCAIQRLMQALGAYGFLGHEKQRPQFLQHIPKALQSLSEAAGRVPGLEDFAALLADLPS